MSLIVITGAVRSGKSAAAERLARGRQGRAVIAVGGREDDEEMKRRIAEHRAKRPPSFEVREVGTDASWVSDVPLEAVLVVECMATLVGAIVAESGCDGLDIDAVGERALQKRVDSLVGALCARSGDTIVVTNETGWGVVPAYASGRAFRDLMGSANRVLVERADAAYAAVGGRFLDLKAMPGEPEWPAADGEER